MTDDQVLPELHPETQKVVDWLGMDHPIAQSLLMNENPMMIEVIIAVLESFSIELDYLRSEVERLESLLPPEEADAEV